MIDSYVFGRIVIDGRVYTRDLVLTRDRVWEDWWREQGHRLSLTDLVDVFKVHPKVLIVGTGYSGSLEVLSKTKHFLESKDIEVFVYNTRKACRKYNELSKTKRVVAALHLTC